MASGRMWCRAAAAAALAGALALVACEEPAPQGRLAWAPSQEGAALWDGPSLAEAAEGGLDYGVLAVVASYQPIVPTLRMDADIQRLEDGVASAALRTGEVGIRTCPGLSDTQYQTTRDQVASHVADYRTAVNAIQSDLAASPPATIAAARTFMLATTNGMRTLARNLNGSVQLRMRELSNAWVSAGRPRRPAPSQSPVP